MGGPIHGPQWAQGKSVSEFLRPESAKAANPLSSMGAAGLEAMRRAREARRQDAATGGVSFQQYIDISFPNGAFVWGKHHLAYVRLVEAVQRGVVTRAIVNVPPRHSKSEVISVRAPAWLMGQEPDAQFICATHTADLSYKFSRQVRSQITDADWPWPHLKIDPAARAVREWQLAGRRGIYFAVGVGGGVSGRGADYLLIDDPVRSRQYADSESQRETLWQWYLSDIVTRLQPGGRIILVMTRWHVDDLAGRLIRRMETGEGESWDVLHLPAIAEESAPEYALKPGTDRWREIFSEDDDRMLGVREGCEDALGREPGQALFPQFYNEESLLRTRDELTVEEGPRAWWALYQGSPRPDAGVLWDAGWFSRRYKAISEFTVKRLVQCVDTAWKEGSSSAYSVIATWALVETVNGPAYALLGVWRARVNFDSLVTSIIREAEHWYQVTGVQPEVHIEDYASGIDALQILRRRSELLVIPWKPPARSSKESRAEAALPAFRAGRVILPESAPWLRDWLDEHLLFPASRYMDQVDTTSMAMNLLYTGGWGEAVVVGEFGHSYDAGRVIEGRARPALPGDAERGRRGRPGMDEYGARPDSGIGRFGLRRMLRGGREMPDFSRAEGDEGE